MKVTVYMAGCSHTGAPWVQAWPDSGVAGDAVTHALAVSAMRRLSGHDKYHMAVIDVPDEVLMQAIPLAELPGMPDVE